MSKTLFLHNNNTEKVIRAQWVECRTDNQAARVQIPANTNEFFLRVFLAPGGSELI